MRKVTNLELKQTVRYLLEARSEKPAAGALHRKIHPSATSGQIWADRLGGILYDIFELQDRVESGVVGAIEPRRRLS